VPTLYQNIRGMLQARAVTASGFPGSAQRAYEGVAFSPTVGTAWARMTLVPTQGRSAVIGGALKAHQGLFLVDLFYPSGQGTASVESVADAVKAVFAPGDTLTLNGESLRIRYAERNQPLAVEADWISAQVQVGWLCHSPNN